MNEDEFKAKLVGAAKKMRNKGASQKQIQTFVDSKKAEYVKKKDEAKATASSGKENSTDGQMDGDGSGQVSNATPVDDNSVDSKEEIGESSWKNINNHNKDLNFVKRANDPNAPKINNEDGSVSTHKLAAEVDENGEWFVFPTIIQDENGELKEFETHDEAFAYAKKSGELIPFKGNKDEAIAYSVNGLIDHRESGDDKVRKELKDDPFSFYENFKSDTQKAAEREGITEKEFVERQISLSSQDATAEKIKNSQVIEKVRTEWWDKANEAAQKKGRPLTKEEEESLIAETQTKIKEDPRINDELSAIEEISKTEYDEKVLNFYKKETGFNTVIELEDSIKSLRAKIKEADDNQPIMGQFKLDNRVAYRDLMKDKSTLRKMEEQLTSELAKYQQRDAEWRGVTYTLDGRQVSRIELENYVKSPIGLERLAQYKSSAKTLTDEGGYKEFIQINGVDKSLTELIEHNERVGKLKEKQSILGMPYVASIQGATATSIDIVGGLLNLAISATEMKSKSLEERELGMLNRAKTIKGYADSVRPEATIGADAIDKLMGGDIGGGIADLTEASVTSLPYSVAASNPMVLMAALSTNKYAELRNDGVSRDKALAGALASGVLNTADAMVTRGILKGAATTIGQGLGTAAKGGVAATRVQALKGFTGAYAKELPVEFLQGTGDSIIDDWARNKEVDMDKAIHQGALESLSGAPTSVIASMPHLAQFAFAGNIKLQMQKSAVRALEKLADQYMASENEIEAGVRLKQFKILRDGYEKTAQEAVELSKVATETETDQLVETSKKIFDLENALLEPGLSDETIAATKEQIKELSKEKDGVLNEITKRAEEAKKEEVSKPAEKVDKLAKPVQSKEEISVTEQTEKVADIERRREEELGQQMFGGSEIREALIPTGETGFISQGYKTIRDGIVEAMNKGFLSEKEKTKAQKEAQLWLNGGMSLSDVATKINERYGIKVSGGKWTLQENTFNDINAKYDAELEALNKQAETVQEKKISDTEQAEKGKLEGKTYTTQENEVFNIEIYDAENGKIDDIKDRTREDRLSMTMVDKNGKSVGSIGLWAQENGEWVANIVNVNEDHRRKGIATAMYDFAEANGFKIADSKIQTDEGKAFKTDRANLKPETLLKGAETQTTPKAEIEVKDEQTKEVTLKSGAKVVLDAKGSVVSVHKKDGTEVHEYITKKKKRVGRDGQTHYRAKNPNYSKMVAEATGGMTANQINNEFKKKLDDALNRLPLNAGDAALMAFAGGAKVTRKTITDLLKEDAKKHMWATSMDKESNLDSGEHLSELIWGKYMGEVDLDQQEVQEEIETILGKFTSLKDVQEYVIAEHEKAQGGEVDPLSLMSDKELEEYGAWQIATEQNALHMQVEDAVADMADEQKQKYYDEQYKESFEGLEESEQEKYYEETEGLRNAKQGTTESSTEQKVDNSFIPLSKIDKIDEGIAWIDGKLDDISDIPGLLIAPKIERAALEAAKAALVAGKTVAQAINAGIQSVKDSKWYKGLDEQAQREARNQAKEIFSTHRTPTKGANEGVIDLDYTHKSEYAQKFAQFFEDFRTGVQDRWLRLTKLQEAATKQIGLVITDEIDAYTNKELEAGRTAATMNDFKRKIIQSAKAQKDALLEEMAKAKVDINKLGLYMYALHAVERNEFLKETAISEGREDIDNLSGMSQEQAEEIIAEAKESGDQVKFDEFAKRIREEIINPRLKLLLDSGLITEEEFEDYSERYEHYVPLGVEEKAKAKRRHAGKGSSLRGKDIYRAKGSSFYDAETRTNPVEGAIMAMLDTIERAQKNETAKSLARLAEAIDDPNVMEVYKPKYEPKYDENGEVVSVERRTNLEDGKNIIEFKVDGKPVLIEVKDDRLYQALEKSAIKVGQGDKFTNAFEKMLIGTNNYLRNINTLLNPEFLFSNFSRDIQTAMINISAEDAEGMALAMAKKVPMAFKGVIDGQMGKNTKWGKIYQEYEAAGGVISWTNLNDLETVQKEINDAIGVYSSNSTAANFKKTAKSAIKGISMVSDAVEMSSRLAAYQTAIEKGYSKQKAASLAKNLTVNFEKKGMLGTVINTFYLFANAGIQGTAVMFKAMTKSGKGGRRARAIAGSVVAASYLNAVFNAWMADDDWDKVQDFERERKMVWMRSNGSSIDIPLPYGYNILWVTGQVAHDMVSGRKDFVDSFITLIGAAESAFNPIAAGSMVESIFPTVARPFLQSTFNVNWFGAPIMPKQPAFQPDVKDSSRYFGSVRDRSKQFANWMNKATGGDEVKAGAIDISPETLDHFFDFASGGLGKFISNVSQTGNVIMKGEEDVSLDKVPFVRTFYTEPRKGNDLSLVYDMVKKSEITEFTSKQKTKFKKTLESLVKDGTLSMAQAKKLATTWMKSEYLKEKAKKQPSKTKDQLKGKAK